MFDEETVQSIRGLRQRSFSPAEIARCLGLRRAEVAQFVRTLAAERETADPAPDNLECWLNAGWSAGLSISGHPEWHEPTMVDGQQGLVTAVVVRRQSHRRAVKVCVYLVDVYCLGVKNAMGPDSMDERDARGRLGTVYLTYRESPVRAPIELVRDVVFGGVEYARGLGFDPHRDFESARAILGAWSGPSAITFGCWGVPTYVEGPYDDAGKVLRTLERTVGRDGFRYTVEAGALV